jgi:hypothetical protein
MASGVTSHVQMVWIRRIPLVYVSRFAALAGCTEVCVRKSNLVQSDVRGYYVVHYAVPFRVHCSR